MATKNVIATETEASVTSLTSKGFLLSNPPGAYTTARTCGGGCRIFEWESHVERTASSLESMMEEDGDDRWFPLRDRSTLRRRLDASLEEAVRLHKEANDEDPSRELKITTLVGWWEREGAAEAGVGLDDDNKGGGRVACHVTSLPQIPAHPVRVEVRGSPRENAASKDSSWVAGRAPLEALMSQAEVAPVNEFLLTTGDGEILEGSQTNFYAVIGGAVHTAGKGILKGTVRGLILDICRREGIPIVLRPPSLVDLAIWEGAIVSSTSRLALPVNELYIPVKGSPSRRADLRRQFDNDGPNSVAARIQQLVSMEVEHRSTPIGNPVQFQTD